MKERNLGTVISVVMHLCVISLLLVPSFTAHNKPLNVVMVNFSHAGDSFRKLSTPNGDATNIKNRKLLLKTEKVTQEIGRFDRPTRENPLPVQATTQGGSIFTGVVENYTSYPDLANTPPDGSGSTIGLAGSSYAGGQEKGSLAGESEDYKYIRDAVMTNVHYPDRARKLGLEGKVLLSFVVLEDGTTSEIKLLDSSSYRILDQSAKEAVAGVRIAKKVAYKIVVRLPIVYKLQREKDDLT